MFLIMNLTGLVLSRQSNCHFRESITRLNIGKAPERPGQKVLKKNEKAVV
jgi:hypothetical protein